MEQEKHSKMREFIKETLRLFLSVLLIVLPIRFFIAQPFIVSGASMVPTFHDGEYLIVDQISYRFEEPERGEVIIFKYPNDTSKYYIKRIIGLPGESIKVIGSEVTITENDGDIVDIEEPYALSTEGYPDIDTTLKSDEFFVMGDNRPASSDSRIWGPLQRKFIVGKALFRLLPVSKIDIMPGQNVK